MKRTTVVVSNFTIGIGVTTEQIMATLVVPLLAEGGGPLDTAFVIDGSFNLTVGTTATGVNIRVRRTAALTGTQVGPTLVHTQAAGAAQNVSFSFADLPLPSGPLPQNYILTLQNIGTSTGVTTVAYLVATLTAST